MEEDPRICRLSELLSYRPAAGQGERLSPVEREFWTNLQRHREALRTDVLKAAERLFDFDRCLLGRAVPTGVPRERSLERAIRAAEPLVRRSADWSALLMLMRERGWATSAGELSELIAYYAPLKPCPSRQSLEQGVWDTERRRFPHWERTGIARAKFERHYAIATAAAPFL